MAQQDDHWTSVENACDLLETGEVESAIEALQRVIVDEPNNEYAYFLLGGAFFEAKRYPQSLKGYTQALALKPDYPGALVGAGHALRMMGEYDRAIRMAQRILSLGKDDDDGLYLIGMAHYQRGDNQLAYGFLQRFLETQPQLEVALEVEGVLDAIRQEEGFAVGEDVDG